MSRSISKMSALGLALFPVAASAHDDHGGLHGLVHVLTEPLHLGLALLALISGGLAVRFATLARRRHERNDAV